MTTPLLAIIGGSGLYDLPGLADTRWETVDTPWGAPSDQIFRGRLGDAQLAFLPRHGRGHRIPPSEVNYRANIAALKMRMAKAMSDMRPAAPRSPPAKTMRSIRSTSGRRPSS